MLWNCLSRNAFVSVSTAVIPKRLCVTECLWIIYQKTALQQTVYSREITVIDYGITNDTEKFVTEIIIPVKKQG